MERPEYAEKAPSPYDDCEYCQNRKTYWSSENGEDLDEPEILCVYERGVDGCRMEKKRKEDLSHLMWERGRFAYY